MWSLREGSSIDKLEEPNYAARRAELRRAAREAARARQCAIFTGMRLVFGDILISFGVVWYSGMRKWYAGFSVVVAAVGVVPGAKPCKSAGITRVYPGFSRYTRKIPGICRFCRFCHQEGTPTRFDFREATGIPYHFLISAGLGFD